MPSGSPVKEHSRLDGLGYSAERVMLRRMAIGLVTFGGSLELVYISAFRPPDWTDAVAIAVCVFVAAATVMVAWQRISLRWMIAACWLCTLAVGLIAAGDDIAVGMGFLFLPSALMMFFFWHDRLFKIAILPPAVAVYVGVPVFMGNRDAINEAIATAPVLIGSALLLGWLFSRFRGATLEQSRFRGTITALLMALDARDDYTAEHSSEVLSLVMSVSEKLGLSPERQLHVADVALLHDVGKIGIPNEILHKPDTLDAAEWEVMKRHPEIGERILAEVPGFEAVAEAVRHEHERWDGRGYPDGKKGEEIPLASRIVLACDAYHAMTSDRPYRQPMGEMAARNQLITNAGTQFDPRVIDALLGVLEERERDREAAAALEHQSRQQAATPDQLHQVPRAASF